MRPAAGEAACPDLNRGRLGHGNYRGMIKEPDEDQ